MPRGAAFVLVPSVLVVLAVSFAPAETSQPTFMLVVNTANPVNQLSKDHVSTLFLDRTARWSHGVDAEPVDQSTKSPLREAFCKEVLGRTVLSVQSYWQQRILTQHEVPPPVKATDADVLAYVAKHKGAIGYVAADATLPDGVKRLRLE